MASKDTPVDQLLYRPEQEVGSRGDIIQFYNKLFIGFIKDSRNLHVTAAEMELRII